MGVRGSMGGGKEERARPETSGGRFAGVQSILLSLPTHLLMFFSLPPFKKTFSMLNYLFPYRSGPYIDFYFSPAVGLWKVTGHQVHWVENPRNHILSPVLRGYWFRG